MKNIAILGSTGSIGTQALDIIEANPHLFKASVLTANNNWEMLANQALKFKPELVVINNNLHVNKLREALEGTDIKVESGEENICYAPTLEKVDIVLTALVGYSGLLPTISAIKNGKTIALANKETLVVAGEIITALAKENKIKIIPVDSEHSAIFQCLQGEDRKKMKKILLTASGGPFRNLTKEELKHVTVKQALNHPNWDMGAKVTIDSATMMNKGFEMIEARWLFNISPRNIDVVVHPESVVHSLVEFIDGSVKAQLGLPDMRLPIEVALSYPQRIKLLEATGNSALNLAKCGKLTFEEPDTEKFPLLDLAYRAAEAGGLVPALMNAANEVAVKAFLEERIGFKDISRMVVDIVEKFGPSFKDTDVTIESIAEAHKEGTEIARNLIDSIMRNA